MESRYAPLVISNPTDGLKNSKKPEEVSDKEYEDRLMLANQFDEAFHQRYDHKLVFDVWNENEIKLTGAHECADGWHESMVPLGTGETLDVVLPLGPRLVTLEVRDGFGRSSFDGVWIDVEPVSCQAGPIEPLALYHVGHSLTDQIGGPRRNGRARRHVHRRGRDEALHRRGLIFQIGLTH